MPKFKYIFFILLVSLQVWSVSAQDYCDTEFVQSEIEELLEQYDADTPVAQISEEVSAIMAQIPDDCSEAEEQVEEEEGPAPNTVENLSRRVQDIVIANSNVNVRSCGATTCSIMGTTTQGQILEVYGEVEDWYAIKWDGETAYIASWLTTPGPDVYIDDPSTVYRHRPTNCRLVVDTSRGDVTINIVISGSDRNDVWVDLYRPNEVNPLTVDSQYDKTFTDTGDPYIHQFYNWGTWWPAGTYMLEIQNNGVTSQLAFDLERDGEHTIFVHCGS